MSARAKNQKFDPPLRAFEFVGQGVTRPNVWREVDVFAIRNGFYIVRPSMAVAIRRSLRSRVPWRKLPAELRGLKKKGVEGIDVAVDYALENNLITMPKHAHRKAEYAVRNVYDVDPNGRWRRFSVRRAKNEGAS
jgi:hypothetical protein